MSLTVKVGDPLPSVGLRATDGYLLNLRSFVTKRPAAFLFFGAPTLKGAARRRGLKAVEALVGGYGRLREAGIEIVGVSCDSEEQQAGYVREASIPFLLYSDERRTAAGMLGLDLVSEGENHNVAKPLAIAVDRDGVVRAIIDKVDPETLVDDLLRALSEPMPAATTGA
jgi:peroxiredoxin Q/BCP